LGFSSLLYFYSLFYLESRFLGTSPLTKTLWSSQLGVLCLNQK
jgi:hypothetical protein